MLPTAAPAKAPSESHRGEGEAIGAELPAACFWLLSLLSAACPSFLLALSTARRI